jgi:hypothetical protein
MSQSVFEKLLGSYSGMRKRTWSLNIISEAESEDKLKKYNDIYGQIKQFLDSAAPGQQQSGFGDNQNITLTKPQSGAGVTISGSNLGKGVTFRNFSDFTSRAANTSNSKVAKVIGAWSPSKKGDSDKGQKSKIEPADAEIQEPIQGFNPTERDAIALYIEKKLGIDPAEAQVMVQKIQDTILTPGSRSKLSTFFEDRPDLAPEMQRQLLDVTSKFFSMAAKVETATLSDGTTVKFIRQDLLTPSERAAGSLITTRGVDGSKGVCFGRNSEDDSIVGDYADLQDYAQSYGDKSYGFTLGNFMKPYGGVLFGAKVLPEGVDLSTMSKEDFNSLVNVSEKSKSVKDESDQNDSVGKLSEDLFELDMAILTGDNKQKKAAMDNLKKRLEALGGISEEDLQNLETPLLSNEMDDLQSLFEEAPTIKDGLKKRLQSVAKKIEIFKQTLGITSALRSERPSTESKMGERADNRIVIEDANTLNSDWSDVMVSNGDGTYTVNASLKEYRNPLSKTVFGSGSIHHAYGRGNNQGYDQLHAASIERAVKDGSISDDQAEACKDALQKDREYFNKLEDTLGSLTAPNKAALNSQLNSMIKNAGNQGFTTIAAQESYISELQQVREALSEGGDPKAAVMKMFQLHRSAKASKDPEYAKAAFVNDSVLSMASEQNEVIVRGSPTEVALGKTHKMFNQLAESAFTKDSKVSMGIGGPILKDSDGNTLASVRVAAKRKPSKQFAEFSLARDGIKKFLDRKPIQ